jgi:hypothetical protein
MTNKEKIITEFENNREHYNQLRMNRKPYIQEIANKTGVTHSYVNKVMCIYHQENESQTPGYKEKTNESREEFTVDEKEAKWYYHGNAKIETLEEALDVSKVDLNVWKPYKHTIMHNAWDMSYKGEGREKTWKDEDGVEHKEMEWDAKTATNRQVTVKVWFKLREEEKLIADVVDDLIARMHDFVPAYQPMKYPKIKKDPCMMLVATVDLHSGSLCIPEETGNSFTIQDACQIIENCVDAAIQKGQENNVEEYVYVIGNDRVNADSRHHKTSSQRTNVDMDQSIYLAWRDTVQTDITCIDRLRRHGKVRVVSVPGNHDTILSLAMAREISAWFRDCPDVEVRVSMKQRDYIQYGNVLLGFTHGRFEKISNLHVLMAEEQRKLWSESECCEFIIADKHAKVTKLYDSMADLNKLVIRRLPSASGTTLYEHSHGWDKVRGSELHIYHKQYGHIDCIDVYV